MSPKKCFLLIEPDEAVRTAISSLIDQQNWSVIAKKNARSLEKSLNEECLLGVVCESSLSDMKATDVLKTCMLKKVPVIFLGHEREVQSSVDLIHSGAVDFLEKPFPQARLINALQRISAHQ